MTNGMHQPENVPQNPDRQEQSMPTAEEAIGLFRGAVADLLTTPEALVPDPTWEAIKVRHGRYEMSAIQAGRQAGVSEPHLRQFARETVEKNLREGDFNFAANFMRNCGLGTPELIAHFLGLGVKQKEERAAKKAAKVQEEKGYVELPPADVATVRDLILALRALRAAPGIDELFNKEVEESAGQEVLDRLIELEAWIGMTENSDCRQLVVDFLNIEPDELETIRFATSPKWQKE